MDLRTVFLSFGCWAIHMQKIRWFFLIIGIVLMLALALQNNDPVEIRLLWLEQSLPLSVFLLATGGVGFLFGALMTVSMLRNRSKSEPASTQPAPASETPADKPETSTLG